MKIEHSYGVVPLRKVRRHWEVLLVQHASSRYWGYPKGHAEEGESPQQAAVRELCEETGLTVKAFLSDDLIEQHYMFRQGGLLISKTVSYFVAEVAPGKVVLQLDEVSAAQWVLLEEAHQVLSYKTDRDVCESAQILLKKRSKDKDSLPG